MRSVSVRSKWAGLGAHRGTPSAPQPMSSACQRFPITSCEIPSTEKVLRRPNIVAVTEEGAELSPNARSANARSANARFWGNPVFLFCALCSTKKMTPCSLPLMYWFLLARFAEPRAQDIPAQRKKTNGNELGCNGSPMEAIPATWTNRAHRGKDP